MSPLSPFPARPCRRLPWYSGGAAEYLASAEALLENVAATGRPALRWYVVDTPALLLGASQKAASVDAAACREAGVAVYQRAAGGLVVLADRDMLGLDVALPRDDPLLLPDLTASYRWLGEAWSAALRSVGLGAALVDVEGARANARDESRETRLARQVCFGGLSPYEVTVCGRKVVGLAQVRRRYGALFQAAVQARWVPARLTTLLALSPDDRASLTRVLEARVTGLQEAAGRPIAFAAVIAAVESALTAQGLVPADDAWTPEERAATTRLLAERYRPIL